MSEGFEGTAPSPAPVPVPPEREYLRQIRNATVTVAVIVVVFAVLELIGVIVTASELSKLQHDINGVNSSLYNSGSNCESQGGTNPLC
jgi:hypothetical protein